MTAADHAHARAHAHAHAAEGEAAMQPHRLDRISLVFGLLFAGLGVAFLVSPGGVLDLPWEWLVPAGVVALGAAVLIPVTRGRREPEQLEDVPEFELEDPEPRQF